LRKIDDEYEILSLGKNAEPNVGKKVVLQLFSNLF